MVVQWKELGLTDPSAIECSNFVVVSLYLPAPSSSTLTNWPRQRTMLSQTRNVEDILITEESLGVLGMDYDFNLHYAVGHMRCIDGALPVHVATGINV
jgi:hypothetical protein